MDKDFWCDFVAGWIGGCTGLLAGHPMDTIKVRQQAVTHTSAAKAIVNTLKFEGVRGFYKGMGFPILTTGAMNSLFFGVYGNTLRWMSSGREKPRYLDIFVAGCCGGVVQLIVAVPVDLVKIKMQVQISAGEGVWGSKIMPKYNTPTQCLVDAVRTQGVSGCYRGLFTMAWRDVIASAVYMLLYCHLTDQEKDPPLGTVFWAGGVAGAISWASILPLDVVKSRIQADDPHNPTYKGFWDCARKSYKADGLSVFTRGFWMMTLRAFPTNGAIFLGYVTSLGLMRKYTTSTRENQA
ncbi:solute carrier family 25 member 45-like isoform X2 [Oratosquilla oratoria]|uniref:solute carrier family 25 member 45-like isoform X2 n=1 Tax=Oratosquilla oratoria TaxID=337810 RepID=UPI003F767AB1